MTSIAERHKYILESLAKNGFIKVNEIAKELEVTPVTIRKDLKHLEEKKLLYRTHGSASPVNPLTSDIDVHEKEKLRKEEKKRIATAAAKLIEENEFYYHRFRFYRTYVCRAYHSHQPLNCSYSFSENLLIIKYD